VGKGLTNLDYDPSDRWDLDDDDDVEYLQKISSSVMGHGVDE
jgi:hypothetical protein